MHGGLWRTHGVPSETRERSLLDSHKQYTSRGTKTRENTIESHFQYVVTPFRVEKAESFSRFSFPASSFRTHISRRPKGETVCLLFIFSTNSNAFVANDMTCLFLFFRIVSITPQKSAKVPSRKVLARVGPDHDPFWAHVGRFYNRKHETPPDGDGME